MAVVAVVVLAAVCEISSFSAGRVSGDSPASDRSSESSSAGSECYAAAVAKVSVWPVAEQTAEWFAGDIYVAVFSVCSSALASFAHPDFGWKILAICDCLVIE